MSQGKQIFAFCHKLLKQDVEYFNITVPQENVNFAQFVPAPDFGMILQKMCCGCKMSNCVGLCRIKIKIANLGN